MAIEQDMSFLSALPVGDRGSPGSLLHLASLIGENYSKTPPKEQLLRTLSAYYLAPNRFDELWDSLSGAERKIASLHVWGRGAEYEGCADEVAAEFGVAKDSARYYYWYSWNGLNKYKEMYAGKKSNLWLLFPGHGDIPMFWGKLKAAAGEMKRTYSKVPSNLEFSTRESRTNDFANIVRFCNSNKLPLTKKGILSKPSALKLKNFCGYMDYSADINEKPEDAKSTDGLLVTYPLTVLCNICGLLNVAEGEFVPGGKSLTLIDLPHEQLVKKLFDAYLSSKSFDEIDVIKGLRSKRGHHPYDARKNLTEELKICPAGQFMLTKEFERYLRLGNKEFARKERRLIVGTGYYASNDGIDWEQYEHPLIYTILVFFGALGIVDIVWGEGVHGYSDSGRRIPVAFRVNPLGAYVLGLESSYAAPIQPKEKIEGGFTVLPDYTIIIPESAKRLKHEIYFEKLFTKVSVTGEASIYKLDFETIARATESGVSAADLRKYLTAADKPVPENVLRALADWKKQVGRIRIRHVTILECDDNALLEEVIRYKGMGELVKGRIAAAVVVDGGAANKIKKTIEKNKRICKNAT